MIRKKQTHPIIEAYCMTCDWRGSGRNAQATAANHARHYGHEVGVDFSICFIYDGRGEEEVSDGSDIQ